ncbi:MAG: CDGSH iron-sulfur domain-containing protein [Rikenellaceae bacterium]
MSEREKGTPIAPKKYRILVCGDGPYMVYGAAPICRTEIVADSRGDSRGYSDGQHSYTQSDEPTLLCRCGESRNKPYCDSSHLGCSWDSRLTAPRLPPLAQAREIEGEGLILTDSERYCAFARFCDADGGTWKQTHLSGDPQQRELAIASSSLCPAGRLKSWDKQTHEPYEPELELGLSLIEDPQKNCSCGIWVRGGIPITSEDGYTYQPRNRVMLCRCGESANKPFCDGTHASMGFHDELKKEK